MTLPKMKSLAVLFELRLSGWGAFREACSAAKDEGGGVGRTAGATAGCAPSLGAPPTAAAGDIVVALVCTVVPLKGLSGCPLSC